MAFAIACAKSTVSDLLTRPRYGEYTYLDILAHCLFDLDRWVDLLDFGNHSGIFPEHYRSKTANVLRYQCGISAGAYGRQLRLNRDYLFTIKQTPVPT